MTETIPRAQLLNLPVAVSTLLYCGLLPIAPGTWGSAATLVLFLPMRRLPLTWYMAAVAVLFVVGIWAAGATEKITMRKDPGMVVIDECVGMLVTLAGSATAPLTLITGFLLFRFFDIVKPFPVRLAEKKCAGGFGVMADDVVAGIYAFCSLQLVTTLFPGFF